jgi:mono/diheme cytochrome c family protein
MREWGIAVVLLAGACQRQPARTSEPAPITFDGGQVTTAAALPTHGERLTHVLGCTGCHGAHLEGTFFTEHEPQYGPLYASNLTVEVPEYSDAQLDAIIRHGVHPRRKTVWAMPSEIFQNLSDPDFRAVVAYLRTLKPVGKKLPPPQFSAEDKKEIAQGLYQSAVQKMPQFKRAQPVDLGPRYAAGRYVASVTCEECHGSSLEGGPKGMPPNLMVAGGYTRADFEKLIVRGVPTPQRKLNPMMAGVAKTRFAHLTQHERDELYAYLKARADKAQ